MSSKSKGGREPTYDTAFKIAVAREYLTSSLGYGAVAKKYDLKVCSVVFFVRWYHKQYSNSFPEPAAAGAEPEKSNDTAQSTNTLQEANLKITALEMLIEKAGKELGMDLVKKFGTKQPGN